MSRPAPWDVGAEQAVLGAILLEPAAISVVRGLLPDASAFGVPAHRAIYAACCAMTDRGTPIDPPLLTAELEARGSGDATSLLVEIVDAAPSAAHAAHYAAIVRDRAIRRAIVAESHRAIKDAEDLGQPIAPTAERLVGALTSAVVPPAEQRAGDQDRELVAIMDDLERQASLGGRCDGLSSGIDDLDALTDGWVRGRLVVVAARPKVGKTAFLLHCARAAAEVDSSVYFATAEQPRRELLKRLVGMQARLNLREIRDPDRLRTHTAEIARVMQTIRRWPLVMDDRARTPTAVRFGVERWQAQRGRVGLVLVDYLSKFKSGTKQERRDLEIGAITEQFAKVALDLDVPVILASQLNRDSVRGGTVRKPGPADLRDSGAIEQDAAQVIFLWHEPACDPDQLQLLVELNRFGPVGVVNVVFDRTTGRWRRPARCWRGAEVA